jgi:hypothetical protein
LPKSVATGFEDIKEIIEKSLTIADLRENYMAHQGMYLVINVSMKSSKQPSFKMAYECLEEIAKEYKRHAYILSDSCLLEADRERFIAIMERRGKKSDYVTSLEFLSACLNIWHNRF